MTVRDSQTPGGTPDGGQGGHGDGGVADVVLWDEDDPLLSMLRRVQLAVLAHPAAAQAAFRALVAEGRRYAGTPEGSAWRDRLARSPLLARSGYVFEVLTMNLLVEGPDEFLPSQLVDAVVRTTAVPELEPLLSTLFEGGGP